jgi:hypothetical protein
MLRRAFAVPSTAAMYAVYRLRMAGQREAANRLVRAHDALMRTPPCSASRFSAIDRYAHAVIEAQLTLGEPLAGLAESVNGYRK